MKYKLALIDLPRTFDIHDEKFQQYLPIVVNCLRAILFDQRGIHHPLIESFEDTK